MPGPRRSTWGEVVARRFARQALDEPATDVDPADIANSLCGVHAQMLGAAELAIARRAQGQREATSSGRSGRTGRWSRRSATRHGPPDGNRDLPIWTGALSALPMSAPRHPEPVRFTDDEAEEVIAAIRRHATVDKS